MPVAPDLAARSASCGYLVIAAMLAVNAAAQAPTTQPSSPQSQAQAVAPAPATGSITLDVTGFRNDKGQMRVLLFRTAEGFPSEHRLALRAEARPIDKGSASLVFAQVPFGSYAVSVLHDENGNGELDKNFLGLPSEGSAASNNAKGKRGPPQYSDARFELRQPQLPMHLAMEYP